MCGEEYLLLELPIPDWTLPDCLSESERSITMSILRGAKNEEIARERETSIRTVESQVARIFAKVGVSSRIQLAHRLGAKRAPR
jgi:DNA-binding NarL/FixJ family response regulator